MQVERTVCILLINWDLLERSNLIVKVINFINVSNDFSNVKQAVALSECFEKHLVNRKAISVV